MSQFVGIEIKQGCYLYNKESGIELKVDYIQKFRQSEADTTGNAFRNIKTKVSLTEIFTN